MRYSEKIGISFNMINNVLGVFGLALIFGWETAGISTNENGEIMDVQLQKVHLHPAVRKPSWWPE